MKLEHEPDGNKGAARVVVLLACLLALSFVGSVVYQSLCHSATSRGAGAATVVSPPPTDACLDIIDDRDELVARVSVLEGDVTAAELRGYDQCMTDLSERPEPTQKRWPKVLSVFTSRDPDKPDKLAGSSSAWPLPVADIDASSMASDRSTWKRRAVRPDDMAVALRGVPRYTKVRVCQDKRCVEAWTSTTGPWGARCSRPGDCTEDRPCIRRTSDPARPGDDREWWWTIQDDTDGPCVYRGLIDVTPAVCEAIDCTAMKPARYTLIHAHATSTTAHP